MCVWPGSVGIVKMVYHLEEGVHSSLSQLDANCVYRWEGKEGGRWSRGFRSVCLMGWVGGSFLAFKVLLNGSPR